MRIPIACAAAALLVGCAALAASLGAGNWRTSILVRMPAGDALAPLVRASDPGFAFVDPLARYEGVYTYAVARDPFASGAAHGLLDQAPTAYGRPAYGWLAGLASLGRPRALPDAMLVLNLLMFVLAAYLVSRLALKIGRSPWWGMIVALNPGFTAGLIGDTGEPVLLAFATLGLLLWLQRRRVAAAVLAAGCFAGEMGLLVPVGLALYEAVQLARDARSTGEPPLGQARPAARRLALLAVGPVLYGLWTLYLHARLGSWPLSEPGGLGRPLAGVAETAGRAAVFAFGDYYQAEISNAVTPILIVVAVLLALGAVRSARVQTPYQAIALLMALATLSLARPLLLDPRSLYRAVATPVTFVALALLAPEPARQTAGKAPRSPAGLRSRSAP